jgi:polyphosphate kinase
MFHYTDIPDSPWWVVDADEKRRARLNCIHHLLSMIDYQEINPPKLKLPRRQPADPRYMRPPIESMRWVPTTY